MLTGFPSLRELNLSHNSLHTVTTTGLNQSAHWTQIRRNCNKLKYWNCRKTVEMTKTLCKDTEEILEELWFRCKSAPPRCIHEVQMRISIPQSAVRAIRCNQHHPVAPRRGTEVSIAPTSGENLGSPTNSSNQLRGAPVRQIWGNLTNHRRIRRIWNSCFFGVQMQISIPHAKITARNTVDANE